MKREFDSEPVYNEKYLKAKIKIYNGKTNTYFRNDKMLKEGLQFVSLSVTLMKKMKIGMKKVLMKKILMKKIVMMKTKKYIYFFCV